MFSIPTDQFKTVINCVIWAFQHNLSDLYELGLDILKTIYSITITTPYSNTSYTRILIKNEEQVQLLKMFDVELWCPSA